MISIDDYSVEKSCTYKNEEYLVRDNGAVLRKARLNQKVRPMDNQWTFGKNNDRTGYLDIAGVRVHRIVATAFHGEPPTKEHIVDHIDTNRHNNRPTNLRWVTKLENAVLNEATRKKIEYKTGVDIYQFLKEPDKYRHLLTDTDISWMRRVTEEEAQICLENVKSWGLKSSNEYSVAKMGNWVYQYRPDAIAEAHSKVQFADDEADLFRASIGTPLAFQKNWSTPTAYVCCPERIEGDPMECYFSNLSKDLTFCINEYGKSIILDFALVDKREIVIITKIPSGIKHFALAKIIYKNGKYIHENLGSFFTPEGAQKYFTLEQGLEWTGGEVFDDFC